VLQVGVHLLLAAPSVVLLGLLCWLVDLLEVVEALLLSHHVLLLLVLLCHSVEFLGEFHLMDVALDGVLVVGVTHTVELLNVVLSHRIFGLVLLLLNGLLNGCLLDFLGLA
jgi:hypothetical protein